MNILEVLRARILKDFPTISEEELQIRLDIAEKLLEDLRK